MWAGGPDNQVHFEGYQVSNQCMALVRDECLLPCKDAPELGFAKESSPEQYVPDVFYKVRLHLCSHNQNTQNVFKEQPDITRQMRMTTSR